MKFQRGRECGLQESSKQNYLHGAAMMTAGVVVIKILGAIYKIPLGNILGDEGYGYFSVAIIFIMSFSTWPRRVCRSRSRA